MARIKITVLILILIIFTGCTNNNKWSYDLPNKYKLVKDGEIDTKIGYQGIDELKTKDIGLTIYIAEFQYSDNFVGLKCVDKENKNLIVLFFIIDTKNQERYGPFFSEEEYNKESEKLLNGEKYNKFISTLKNPNK